MCTCNDPQFQSEFVIQQLNNKTSSKVQWYIFQAKQYQSSNYGTPPVITNQFLDQDCNGWISSESFRSADYTKMFSVLAKGTIYIPQDSYAQQSLIKSGTIYAKVPPRMRMQEYDGIGGSNMTSPAIFLLMVTNNGDSGTALTGLNLQYQGLFH